MTQLPSDSIPERRKSDERLELILYRLDQLRDDLRSSIESQRRVSDDHENRLRALEGSVVATLRVEMNKIATELRDAIIATDSRVDKLETRQTIIGAGNISLLGLVEVIKAMWPGAH